MIAPERRNGNEMGTAMILQRRQQQEGRSGHSGSHRHNRKGRRDILGRLSTSRCVLLVVLLLSSVFRTQGFMPKTGTSTTSTTSTSTTANSPPATSIDPAQPQCSSSALGMLFGGINNPNPNNNKKNDDDDDQLEWFQKIKILEFIKNVFTMRNQFLDEMKTSKGTAMPFQQPQQQQQDETDPSTKNDSTPMVPTSQFFQPMGIQERNPPIENAFDSYRNPDIFSRYSGGEDLDEDDEDDDDDLPAGTTLLFKIPAKQLKPGGLRLFLMFYLMGMQNTPDRNTWRADQKLMSSNVTPKGFGDDEPEEKTYVLEMLYDKDRSGMLQIELLPSGNKRRRAEIRIYRCGSRPSTSYLMQESVIVDGVLDELQNISGEKDNTQFVPRGDSDDPSEENIADEDRLLITDPPNAIEAARESLAFS